MVDVIGVVNEGLGNTAWVVDLGDGSALVVDPERDPRPYADLARRRGLRIRVVAETHLHADFVSGARELTGGADGTRLVAPADAGLAFDHQVARDGDELDLGGLRLRTLATPGHTPEHASYLLVDGQRPVALFSGGALIVGGVARPDLIAPEQTEPLARASWRSITQRLLELPDELAVYPTHGSGSFCAAGDSDRRSSTIGEERATNPLLTAATENEFVDRLLGGLSSFPPYFLRLREVNRSGPRLYGVDTPVLPALSVEQFDRLRESGAQLIDVRPVAAYAGRHVPGSLAIELREAFATWLGWLVADAATPLVFIAADGQDRDGLVRQCLGVGYERLAGELAGGIDAWADAGRPTAAIQLLDTPVDGRAVLDVRQRSEWEAGHVPGSTHLELGALAAHLDTVPPGPVIVHCAHGQRSTTAASLLERAGRDVAVYTAGPDEWAATQGRPAVGG